MQGGEGLFLLVQGDKSVVAQLPMRGLDRFIRVLSAREEDLQQRRSQSRLCRHLRGNAGGSGMTRARRVLLGAAAGIALAAGYSTAGAR